MRGLLLVQPVPHVADSALVVAVQDGRASVRLEVHPVGLAPVRGLGLCGGDQHPQTVYTAAVAAVGSPRLAAHKYIGVLGQAGLVAALHQPGDVVVHLEGEDAHPCGEGEAVLEAVSDDVGTGD